MSLRDSILAADDITTERVTVPEWGGIQVDVRGLTAASRLDLLGKAVDAETGDVDLKAISVDAVILSALDPETGQPVFTLDDSDALAQKSAIALDRLSEVAMRLGGFGENAQDKAGKGSSTTVNADSSSSSPSA